MLAEKDLQRIRDENCRAIDEPGLDHKANVTVLLAEVEWLRKIRGLQEELLICYRVGRRPSAKCLDGMAAVRKAERKAAKPAEEGD